jgi:hypothetical protein
MRTKTVREKPASDAMNLKSGLRDIEADRLDRLHNLAPPNNGRPDGALRWHTQVPVEEASAASIPDERAAKF